MPQNTSSAAFLRTHKDRYEHFLRKLREFILSLSRNNRDETFKTAVELDTSLGNLKSILTPQDQPDWLKQLEPALKNAAYNSNNQHAFDNLVDMILNLYRIIVDQKWEFAEDDEPPVDFDSIYTLQFIASDLPNVFDELIKKLEEMVASGLIDSVRAINALKKLIATIKRNSKKSYFSSAQTWFYAKTACKHLVFNLGEEIPGVSAFVKTIRHLIEHGDEEWKKVQEGMQAEIKKETAFDIPVLNANVQPQLALPAPSEQTV